MALGIGSASGHSDLQSVDPVDGSVLSVAPDDVVLTFTADVLPDFTQVVTTCDGSALDLPPAVTAGNTVTQPIGPGARGACTLVFRIVSADSHPIAGQTTFTVNAPPAASSSAPAAPASSTSPSRAAPSITPTPTADVPTGTDGAGSGPGRNTWLAISAGLIVLLVGLGLYAARRRPPPA
jgi:Uncharacterized protein, homolog of Cu resistance protein CopC